MRTCVYHPDRPAVGLCMRCRQSICVGCRTPLDGINHCHACLRSLARKTESPRAIAASFLAMLALVGGWGLLTLLCWTVVGRLSP